MNKRNAIVAGIVGLICFSSLSGADDLKKEISANGRVRGEGTWNKNFNSSVDDRADAIGSRFRVDFTLSPRTGTSLFIQPQFSKTWGNPSGTLSDPQMDVHQAKISHKFDSLVQVDIGRQELNYGDQLVVGGVGWSNVGRAFDSVKTRLFHGMGWTDFFIADVSKADSSDGHYFSGIYNGWSIAGIKEVDLYLFHTLNPGGTTARRVLHYGSRIKSKILDDHLSYRVEVTGQSELAAYQVDLELGYLFLKKSQTSVSFEIFQASQNYLQLFPTGHKWLGIGDFLSRRNIRGFRVGAESQPIDQFKVRADFHTFLRASTSAPAYNFGGSSLGNVGSESLIGSEVDLLVTYSPDETLSFSLGGAYFLSGKYIENNVTNAGNGVFYYLQTELKI